MAIFIYIQEYSIKLKYINEFKKFYNPSGRWSQLFRLSPAYIKTELLIDHSKDYRFVTIDYWTSKKYFDEFMSKYNDKFKEIDNKCIEFTSEEKKIGEFLIED